MENSKSDILASLNNISSLADQEMTFFGERSIPPESTDDVEISRTAL